MEMSAIEKAIYNDGERLIPGVTHDIAELIRHRSSYMFFKKIIDFDLTVKKISDSVRIVDLGCGVGYGCYTLSEIENSEVVGVDVSQSCLDYAEEHYSKPNISYYEADLRKFICAMPEFDYVVSRHAFEHIENGINLARSTRWLRRLMFEVPYYEPEGNPHHVLLRITEESFSGFAGAELFFQDLDGLIHELENKPNKPNGIICICSSSDVPKTAKANMSFPLPAWRPQNREYNHLIQEHQRLEREHESLRQEHQSLKQENESLRQEHQSLKQENEGLRQEHESLQDGHKRLNEEHESLQQTRAVILARRLNDYPLLKRIASMAYSLCSIVHSMFKRN
jgi:SAM-dependent methyltransferase